MSVTGKFSISCWHTHNGLALKTELNFLVGLARGQVSGGFSCGLGLQALVGSVLVEARCICRSHKESVMKTSQWQPSLEWFRTSSISRLLDLSWSLFAPVTHFGSRLFFAISCLSKQLLVNTECLVYFQTLISKELRNNFHDALTVSAAPWTDVCLC